ncbi:hypothetical protein BC940DRAFT_287557, partial [Gongronella butleri]
IRVALASVERVLRFPCQTRAYSAPSLARRLPQTSRAVSATLLARRPPPALRLTPYVVARHFNSGPGGPQGGFRLNPNQEQAEEKAIEKHGLNLTAMAKNGKLGKSRLPSNALS